MIRGILLHRHPVEARQKERLRHKYREEQGSAICCNEFLTDLVSP